MIPTITREQVEEGWLPTAHPALAAPNHDQIMAAAVVHGWQLVLDELTKREKKIIFERLDPYRHGYEFPHWKDADRELLDNDELLIMGGNRSSKSEYAAKRVTTIMAQQPNIRAYCLRDTSLCSITLQQPYIFKYLPPELQNPKKSKITNVSYTLKNGFSDGRFCFPNGSTCVFLNWSMDRKVVEGIEADIIWADELIPYDWLETLRYRVVTRRGKILLTFTPVEGYTPVVRDYVAGCRITETRPASLLPNTQNVDGCPVGHMPYKAKPVRKNASVIWFQSEWNVYSPWSQLKKMLDGRGPYELKIRAYGWAEKLTGSMFPRFGEACIVDPDRIPKTGTRYMCVDPAGSRNWFMLWMIVDDSGRRFIYREWPDITSGEWAMMGDASTKCGTAQRSGSGRGIDDYKSLIRHLECEQPSEAELKHEEIFTRYIDPRAGHTKAINQEGGTSLIDLFSADPDPLYFEPAAALRIEEGVAMLNDLFAHDTNKPVSVENEPKLFISRNCENLIFCLREYTGEMGEKEPTKDPVDVLRYLAVMNPEYVDTHRKSTPIRGGY